LAAGLQASEKRLAQLKQQLASDTKAVNNGDLLPPSKPTRSSFGAMSADIRRRRVSDGERPLHTAGDVGAGSLPSARHAVSVSPHVASRRLSDDGRRVGGGDAVDWHGRSLRHTGERVVSRAGVGDRYGFDDGAVHRRERSYGDEHHGAPPWSHHSGGHMDDRYSPFEDVPAGRRVSHLSGPSTHEPFPYGAAHVRPAYPVPGAWSMPPQPLPYGQYPYPSGPVPHVPMPVTEWTGVPMAHVPPVAVPPAAPPAPAAPPQASARVSAIVEEMLQHQSREVARLNKELERVTAQQELQTQQREYDASLKMLAAKLEQSGMEDKALMPPPPLVGALNQLSSTGAVAAPTDGKPMSEQSTGASPQTGALCTRAHDACK
jgi:hypothetical protein